MQVLWSELGLFTPNCGLLLDLGGGGAGEKDLRTLA
jgi:hypothetical protein